MSRRFSSPVTTVRSHCVRCFRRLCASTRRLWRPRRWLIASAVAGGLFAVGIAVFWIAMPFPIERFDTWPTSPRVLARDGRPLLATVGASDEWRTPVLLDETGPWLAKATIAVEDEHFFQHSGICWHGILRAVIDNIAARRAVSGASTITMQVCKMLEPRPRTLRTKSIEVLRALQLERLRSKEQILECYLNIAPYGGNVRGVEAAARRYFAKACGALSLGEAALIAGLPQSPSRLRPDRHPERARQRRAHVLERMRLAGFIDDDQYRIAEAEPIIIADRSSETCRERTATHAAWLALGERPLGGRTTIDLDLQRTVFAEAARHRDTLPPNADLAIVVLHVASGEIRALVGSATPDDPIDGQVNGATARRSPGSTLKPFVYAAALETGRISADTPIDDVRIRRGGWAPRNFDGEFHGRVTVREALARSYNVPAILVAEAIGLERCLGLMRASGLGIGSDAVARRGLALVTGATEVSLLELTRAYATLAQGGVRHPLRLWMDGPAEGDARVMRAEVAAQLDDILGSHRRLPNGLEAMAGEGSAWFMWKTGTSSKRRDAWAIGHNHRYAIGVWVGHFDGGANVAFVGALAAEPLLARLFQLPAIRVDDVPPPAPVLEVDDELCLIADDREPRDRLRIVSPAPRTNFVAIGDTAVVMPRANRSGELDWFLNGRPMASRAVHRLELERGRHRLRCVAPNGEADARDFIVR